MVRRIAALSIAAWLAYSSWICALFLPHDVDNTRAWVSELGALTQPFHAVYSWGDRISGALLILIGVLVYRLWTPLDRLWQFVGGLYVLGGALLMVEAFNPLPCAPSLDPVCRETLLGSNPSIAEVLHGIASFLGTAALVAAFAVSWWRLRRHDGGWWRTLAVVIVLAGVGEAMSGQSVLPLTGLVQRSALTCMGIAGTWSLTWLLRDRQIRPAGSPPGL